MALTSYTELKTSIANYLNRSDLSSVIPDFITLAEAKMNRVLRLRVMQKRVSTTTVANDEFVDLPSDFLEMVQFFVDSNPNVVLDYVNPTEIELDNLRDTSGTPQQYSIIGNEIKLNPIPDSVYTLKLTYFSEIPTLSDSTTTNYILSNYPQVYLYGSLLEAQPYILNDERIQVWMTLYNEAIQLINRDDEQGRYSGRTAFAMKSDAANP
tara:strand:+ start:7141 stop:7770 length:630 start_codon:yes stop_codon:yes gene_type:complete